MEYIYYRISCLDPNVTDFYIGSTKHFCQRKAEHKHNCNNECHSAYKLKIYKTIRKNGGWSNWSMEQIDAQTFDTKCQALIYERGLIETHKPTLNINIPYRSKVERLEQHRQHCKQWNDTHKEQHKAHCKKWRDAHKDYMKTYCKEWRAKKAQQSSSSESDSSSLS